MSVVRLELTIPDEITARYEAQRLEREYAAQTGMSVTGALVTVLSDTEVQRERDILRAASYFMPGGAR